MGRRATDIVEGARGAGRGSALTRFLLQFLEDVVAEGHEVGAVDRLGPLVAVPGFVRAGLGRPVQVGLVPLACAALPRGYLLDVLLRPRLGREDAARVP